MRGPVNIGNPDEITMLDLARLVIALTGSDSDVRYIERPVDDPAVRCPDITLARDKLQWEPRVDAEEGLRRTIDWFRAHSAGPDPSPGATTAAPAPDTAVRTRRRTLRCRSRPCPSRRTAGRGTAGRPPRTRPSLPTRRRRTQPMRILGINALFHDPAAALVIDGRVVAAAEEERFSRRKHGKRPVPFSAWELPEQAASWCLHRAGLRPQDLDAVAYSFDPGLARPAADMGLDDPWDHLRLTYAREAPGFLKTALPGLDPAAVRFVPHHMAHAASSAFAADGEGVDRASVLVLDGRGERASHLAARRVHHRLEPLAAQDLPHSLGLVYEELTAHLGFLRSSDEFKVMALASYGRPRMRDELRRYVYPTGDGGFHASGCPGTSCARPGGRRRRGRRTTRTSRPAPRRCWRRPCSTWCAGCTARRTTRC